MIFFLNFTLGLIDFISFRCNNKKWPLNHKCYNVNYLHLKSSHADSSSMLIPTTLSSPMILI